MNYLLYGPFELPRQNRRIDTDPERLKEFWSLVDEDDDGLAGACGCYVFAIRAGNGATPWYVGKAERQSFKSECITPHKLNIYDDVLSSGKGTPLLYFYSRITPGKNVFSKPSKSRHSDVQYLEKMLISYALRRNRNLSNKRDTKMLRELVVPGLLNGKKGAQTAITKELRSVMGY
jgi:hypothetical protein